MIYITNIDNNSFSVSNSASSAQEVYPKLFYAQGLIKYGQNTDLVTIINKENDTRLLSGVEVKSINLNGTVHQTKEAFVAAFNNMMATEGSSSELVVTVSDTETKDAVDGVATVLTEIKGKQFPGSIHVLSGTEAAPNGAYTGFYAIGEDTAVSAITLVDDTKVTGNNTFSGITLPLGVFIEIPGGFSTITLSAGAMILIKG